MLNVHSVVLTFLLATCAALTGSLPSQPFMAYMLLLRTPDGPVVKWALWSMIAVHAVLPLVSLLLNLAATTDDDIKTKMFQNETTTFNAMRIAGIYSATAGSDLKFAASIVPEVLTALFAFIARRPLSQRPRPGAARNAAQKYSIYWALLLWATMCGAAALFVCSVVGGVFYVFAVVISSSMVFIGTEFTSHSTVTTLGVIGTIVGTLVISVWGVVQNYGAWQYFDGAFSDTVGLKVFCNFVELKDGRCIVQFYLGLIATVCAHVMTHIAVYIGDAKPRGGGAKPLSQSTKQAGRVPHHQHSQQSQQLPLSQRLTRLSATNTGPATATAAEDAMSSKGSIKSSGSKYFAILWSSRMDDASFSFIWGLIATVCALKDGRCIVQFYLGLIATICAHVMTHIAVYIGDAKPRGGAKPLSQSTKQAGRAPHHQHSQQSQQLPLSQRLLENTATRLSATNTGPATATAAEDAMSSKGSIKSPSIKSSLFLGTFLGTADVVAAIMRLFRFLATWIMMNFIVLPLFPLMCLVADLIIFPTIPTLALLPLVFCGLLKPSLMHAVMPYHIALMALLFMSQYFIYASADRGVSTLTKLFLRETTTGWQLLEIGINLAAYAVLLATYEQQKRFGSKGARRERKQKALEHQRKEEAHLMKECVEHRLQVATITTTPTPTPANRPRSDSMRSDTFSTRGSNTITMTSATRESAARFIQQQEEREEQHRSQSRLGMGEQHASSFEVEIEDDETLIERSVVLLGEERVRRIQQLLSERPGSTRDTQCFHRLTGRLPTDEELQALRRSSAMEVGSNPNLLHDGEIVTGPPEDPIRCILRRRRVQAALPMWRQLIHDLSILINHYSLNECLRQVEAAPFDTRPLPALSTVTEPQQTLHDGQVVEASCRRWFLVCYISALTLFEVIFTFVNRFLDTNGEEYLAPGIHAHTIGLVEMPSRWTAICYFTVLFFVCGQYHLLKVSSISWDETVYVVRVAAPDQRPCRATHSTEINIGSGRRGEASPKLLWKLWLAASIYSGLVMLFVSLYQFRDIATRVNEGLRSIKGCDVNLTITDVTTCQQEIGIVAPSGYVLTYFLAPWFVALVTAVAHMSSVSRTAAAATRDEARQRLRQENNLSQRHITGPAASTTRPSVTSETSRLLMTRAGSAGTPAEMLPLKNTDQDNDDDVSYALDGSDEGGGADDPTGMLAAARRFAAPDQLMFHFIVWVVNGIEVLSDILAWIGHEYGALLVWGALYIAATTEYTLMAAVYAVFLVFDWSSVASLIYCVLHLTALYAYQFSFTPTINVASGNVNWAELIGLIKNDSPEMNAVGPVLVFFAVLYRFKTSNTPAFTSSIGVAASAPSASTGNVLMHAKVKAWLSFFHHQGFHLIGYEMLVMFSLLNVQESIQNACGSLAGIILVILMWAGRSQFFNSRLLSFVLRVLFFFLCAMQLLVRLNAAHNMWTVPPTLVYKYFAWERTSPTSQWEHWAGTGSVLGMFIPSLPWVVLHMLRNKQAQTQAHYNNVNHTNDDNNHERVELWVQRNLYFDARSFTWYLSDLFSDPDKNRVLLADGLNQRQPSKKREGNVLRNLSTEKLNHYVPEIPNSLDVNTGLPIVQRAAGSPQQQQQTQQSPPKPGSDLHSQPTSTPIASNLGRRGGNAGDINGSVMDLRRLNNSNSSATPPTSHFTCISPPPRHLLFYDALMTFVVRANSFLSPVAIFSFAAGTMLPSILCTLLMVAGMMQFAYRDQLNWKFYRLWPKILLAYIAALIVMPMAMNVPVVGNWATDKMNNIASIIGLLENGVPTGISGMRAALLFMIAFQTRIYEEFWFERMIRAMRSDLEKRCHKHTELMRHIADSQRKDVENADVRDKQLRDRLRRVREMYGGIQFETASPCGGEDDPLPAAAAAAAVAPSTIPLWLPHQALFEVVSTEEEERHVRHPQERVVAEQRS
ncbi:membrane-associated protein, putative [Bodo saltans]|uniref:Membrane-associated protein, putative n=1 Tax=Bodo saltans TaxID=75058 RepID=A0A0S4JIE4_BODSA|nr:membrane-associated protein, putative [Bodo saltans]|eukprot:CUG89832.1 membrane-associated protein, putative [Bodo saltans]